MSVYIYIRIYTLYSYTCVLCGWRICHRCLPRVYLRPCWKILHLLVVYRNIRKMTALTVLHKFWSEYTKNTSKKLKIIDAYLLYVFLTGVIQFVYCCLVGTFPFNSFLSGFISCVSCFILGGNYIIYVFDYIFYYCGIISVCVVFFIIVTVDNHKFFFLYIER